MVPQVKFLNIGTRCTSFAAVLSWHLIDEESPAPLRASGAQTYDVLTRSGRDTGGFADLVAGARITLLLI